jgi:hypothetical protein
MKQVIAAFVLLFVTYLPPAIVCGLFDSFALTLVVFAIWGAFCGYKVWPWVGRRIA